MPYFIPYPHSEFSAHVVDFVKCSQLLGILETREILVVAGSDSR